MPTRSGTCSGSRTSSDERRRRAPDRAAAAGRRAVGVPARPAAARRCAAREPRGEGDLCSFASGLAALGSRSRRPSRRRPRCAGAGVEIAFVPITTAGDRDRTRPFGQIGERGVFVKEIEEALLAGRIDVAVHSAKDMTSTDTDGLAVGAYLERDDPRDALVGADGIRPGMRIGTASARRRAQLLALEPTLSIEPLRGNVDTRLRKLRERGLDAIVLAACGLDRLGLVGGDRRAARARRDAARGGAGRARAAGAGRRGGARRARRPRRDPPPRRARARVRRDDRRRLPRARRRPPRRRDAARADRRRGRRVGRAAQRRRSRSRSRASCARAARGA